MAVSAEEYSRKFHREMERHGTTRDEAVRRTNVACGYGDSTALQHEIIPEDPKPEPKDAEPESD